MYKIRKVLAMAVLFAFTVFLMTGSFPIRANAAQTTQTEFIKGMDLSSLEAVEDW